MTAIVEGNQNRKYRQEFDELYRENRQKLYRKAYRIIGNHHDAEDALHNAFMNLMKRPTPKEAIQNPVGYLLQATRNAARDAVRMRSRRLLMDVSLEDGQVPAPGGDSQLDERLERMRLALAQMNPKFVDTLDLCCMEGLTVRRVAKIRRRAFGTVAADLYRAKFEVRRLIRNQEKHDEAQKNERQRMSRPGMANPSTT